ncbi:hypothetical protein [Catalinimonas locisalis]
MDLCFRLPAFTTEEGRMEFLFNLYNEYTQPLLKVEKSKEGSNTD